MAKRRGRQFFEVFRAPDLSGTAQEPPPIGSAGPISAQGEASPSVDRGAATPGPPASSSPENGPARPRISRGGGNVAFRLTYSSTGLLILVAVVMLILSHVWGYHRGFGDRSQRETGQADDQRVEVGAGSLSQHTSTSGSNVAAGGVATTGKAYGLCIITYRDPAHASATIKKLKQRFGGKYANSHGEYQFLYVRVGESSWPAVVVGKLSSTTSPEARQLQREFTAMPFENETKPFKEAYYVTLN